MTSHSVQRRDLLVEIGTEELPPKALSNLSRAFTDGLCTRLREAGLALGAVRSLATPRRLAVVIKRVAEQTPAQTVKRRGPPVKASFDAAGAATRAALAFATSCGTALEAIGREVDPKGVEYLSFEGIKPGVATASLLPAMVQETLDALPIPKRMRWGTLDASFVRPVHWLVILHGNEVVPAQLFGIASGRETRGHRFMANKQLRISSPANYEKMLRARGRVIAAQDERMTVIRQQVETLAQAAGGRALIAPELLEEVAALVEWPVAIAGNFEARFLTLPREVLISTLQEHQRYFPVEAADGTLLPTFITVANIDSPEPQVVRAGNERVVRPRLADAAFFWDTDRKQPLHERCTALASVTFQAALGSMAARTDRIVALARQLAPILGADPTDAARAAQLCKADLLTAMVGEFPELQGTMGGYYALADGEKPAVARAIAEHYLPRGAGGALPQDAIGDAVALADKLDLLAGIFAIGQKPSGTRDPFALRRAAIGLLRILAAHRIDLDLRKYIAAAVALQPVAEARTQGERIGAEVLTFVMERLRAQYLEEAGAASAITTEMFDAVAASQPSSTLDFDARLQALRGFLARPEGASLAAANKRIANILRKSGTEAGAVGSLDPRHLTLAAETALHGAVTAAAPEVQAAVTARNYSQALDRLAALRPAVDGFFDQVLVNDPDPQLRANRLKLLGEVRSQFNGIADLSCLPG